MRPGNLRILRSIIRWMDKGFAAVRKNGFIITEHYKVCKMKRGLLICIMVMMIGFCACDTADNTNIENVSISETNLTITEDSDDYTNLNIEVFKGIIPEENSGYFLITKDVSVSQPVHKTNADQTAYLLEWISTLPVKQSDEYLTDANFYLLFRNEENKALCLLEVWEGYICIDHKDYYEVKDTDIYGKMQKVYELSEALNKVSIEDVLVERANISMENYNRFQRSDVVEYQGMPAILTGTGYDNYYSEEEYYFECYLCCGGVYFDAEYQTCYQLETRKIYYNEDGSIYGDKYDIVAYFDYFKGEWVSPYDFMSDSAEVPKVTYEEDSIEKINTYMISEQTFDVQLEDWGEVTFVSCEPSFYIQPEDASFFLIRDEELLYKFPYQFENNSVQGHTAGHYDSVAAVKFQDINHDEKQDIIIIVNYISGAGPTGMEPQPNIKIYLTGEAEFYIADEMVADVEGNILKADRTIENVCEYIEANY